MERDKKQDRWFRRNGWKSILIREHEMKDIDKILEEKVEDIFSFE